MSVELEKQDRRIYFRGKTQPIEPELRDIGASWDETEEAWWIPSSRRRTAEDVLARTTEDSAVPLDEPMIIGTAMYRGLPYLLMFSGRTRKGFGIKLCTLSGNRSFWAKDPGAAKVERYPEAVSLRALANR